VILNEGKLVILTIICSCVIGSLLRRASSSAKNLSLSSLSSLTSWLRCSNSALCLPSLSRTWLFMYDQMIIINIKHALTWFIHILTCQIPGLSRTFNDLPMSNSKTFSKNSQTLNARKSRPIFSMKAGPQWMDIKLTQTMTRHFGTSVTTEFLYAYNWKYTSILNL